MPSVPREQGSHRKDKNKNSAKQREKSYGRITENQENSSWFVSEIGNSASPAEESYSLCAPTCPAKKKKKPKKTHFSEKPKSKWEEPRRKKSQRSHISH